MKSKIIIQPRALGTNSIFNHPRHRLTQPKEQEIKDIYLNAWEEIVRLSKEELEQMWSDYKIFQQLLNKLPAELVWLIWNELGKEAEYSTFQKAFLEDFRQGMDKIQRKEAKLAQAKLRQQEKVLSPQLSSVTASGILSQPPKSEEANTILCQQMIANKPSSFFFWMKSKSAKKI